MKKFLSIVLSVILIISIVPLGITASAQSSGQCGDNAYWSIANNTLTISGSGRMYSYSSDGAPWQDYHIRETYNRVVISSGITSIGAYAFYFCDNIISVSVPSTVTMFGRNSFADCDALRSITIPQGVKSIPEFCFDDCTSLENINIPDSVQYFGQSAFQRAGIVEFTIPEGVTKLPLGMFWGCSNLQKVTIPKSVTEIDSFAFQDCGNLTDIYYGGTQSDYSKIENNLSRNNGLLSAAIHYKCDANSHKYDNSCDDTCNLCGYKRTVTHTYTNSCDTTCNICGYKRKTTHQYDNSCDEICNVCGYKRTVTHSYSTTWNYDVEQHWQSCSICGKKRNSAKHNFNRKTSSNGTQLLVCSICKFETPDKEPCKNNAIKPIVVNVTTNSITLMALDGYEYSIDGQKFQSSTTFYGLTENRAYTVYQRIKETEQSLPSKSSSITVRTAFNGETTNTYFDKLKSYITTHGTIEAQDENYSYKISNQDSGIKFEVVDSNMNEILAEKTERYEFRKLDFVLYKGVKDISINGVSNWPPTNCKTVVDRTTYTVGKTYKFDSFSALDDSTVNTLYSKFLDLLCLKSEQVIFVKLGFGLCELGFTHFRGVGNPACDPVSGYHTGKTEVRYQRNALCTIDGYTGDTYCATCGIKLKTGTVIPSAGKHTYSSKCAEKCTVCGFMRDGDHSYSGDCDRTCNICGHTRKTTVAHTYDSNKDRVCKVCGAKRILGDLNNDGNINSLDGLILLRYLNGWKIDGVSPDVMDVNGDGVVNSLDGLMLMRYLNGWNIEL